MFHPDRGWLMEGSWHRNGIAPYLLSSKREKKPYIRMVGETKQIYWGGAKEYLYYRIRNWWRYGRMYYLRRFLGFRR